MPTRGSLMELRLAQTPLRRCFWVSSSGTGKRVMISFRSATAPSSRTTLTARLQREARRPIPAARPPYLMSEEPMTVPRCREAQHRAILEDEAVDPRLRVDDA